MADKQRQGARKPATKFAHLRKKMQKQTSKPIKGKKGKK
jgi:hypothetical protein